ncbi:hypothetical protein H0X48_01070 [Candidatus Dependentiae bacterium]|nr:hypothetical protein [Candidatus Dependentiae bacterium]
MKKILLFLVLGSTCLTYSMSLFQITVDHIEHKTSFQNYLLNICNDLNAQFLTQEYAYDSDYWILLTAINQLTSNIDFIVQQYGSVDSLITIETASTLEKAHLLVEKLRNIEPLQAIFNSTHTKIAYDQSFRALGITTQLSDNLLDTMPLPSQDQTFEMLNINETMHDTELEDILSALSNSLNEDQAINYSELPTQAASYSELDENNYLGINEDSSSMTITDSSKKRLSENSDLGPTLRKRRIRRKSSTITPHSGISIDSNSNSNSSDSSMQDLGILQQLLQVNSALVEQLIKKMFEHSNVKEACIAGSGSEQQYKQKLLARNYSSDELRKWLEIMDAKTSKWCTEAHNNTHGKPAYLFSKNPSFNSTNNYIIVACILPYLTKEDKDFLFAQYYTQYTNNELKNKALVTLYNKIRTHKSSFRNMYSSYLPDKLKQVKSILSNKAVNTTAIGEQAQEMALVNAYDDSNSNSNSIDSSVQDLAAIQQLLQVNSTLVEELIKKMFMHLNVKEACIAGSGSEQQYKQKLLARNYSDDELRKWLEIMDVTTSKWCTEAHKDNQGNSAYVLSKNPSFNSTNNYIIVSCILPYLTKEDKDFLFAKYYTQYTNNELKNKALVTLYNKIRGRSNSFRNMYSSYLPNKLKQVKSIVNNKAVNTTAIAEQAQEMKVVNTHEETTNLQLASQSPTEAEDIVSLLRTYGNINNSASNNSNSNGTGQEITPRQEACNTYPDALLQTAYDESNSNSNSVDNSVQDLGVAQQPLQINSNLLEQLINKMFQHPTVKRACIAGSGSEQQYKQKLLARNYSADELDKWLEIMDVKTSKWCTEAYTSCQGQVVYVLGKNPSLNATNNYIILACIIPYLTEKDTSTLLDWYYESYLNNDDRNRKLRVVYNKIKVITNSFRKIYSSYLPSELKQAKKKLGNVAKRAKSIPVVNAHDETTNLQLASQSPTEAEDLVSLVRTYGNVNNNASSGTGQEINQRQEACNTYPDALLQTACDESNSNSNSVDKSMQDLAAMKQPLQINSNLLEQLINKMFEHQAVKIACITGSGSEEHYKQKLLERNYSVDELSKWLEIMDVKTSKWCTEFYKDSHGDKAYVLSKRTSTNSTSNYIIVACILPYLTKEDKDFIFTKYYTQYTDSELKNKASLALYNKIRTGNNSLRNRYSSYLPDKLKPVKSVLSNKAVNTTAVGEQTQVAPVVNTHDESIVSQSQRAGEDLSNLLIDCDAVNSGISLDSNSNGTDQEINEWQEMCNMQPEALLQTDFSESNSNSNSIYNTMQHSNLVQQPLQVSAPLEEQIINKMFEHPTVKTACIAGSCSEEQYKQKLLARNYSSDELRKWLEVMDVKTSKWCTDAYTGYRSKLAYVLGKKPSSNSTNNYIILACILPYLTKEDKDFIFDKYYTQYTDSELKNKELEALYHKIRDRRNTSFRNRYSSYLPDKLKGVKSVLSNKAVNTTAIAKQAKPMQVVSVYDQQPISTAQDQAAEGLSSLLRGYNTVNSSVDSDSNSNGTGQDINHGQETSNMQTDVLLQRTSGESNSNSNSAYKSLQGLSVVQSPLQINSALIEQVVKKMFEHSIVKAACIAGNGSEAQYKQSLLAQNHSAEYLLNLLRIYSTSITSDSNRTGQEIDQAQEVFNVESNPLFKTAASESNSNSNSIDKTT